MKVALLHYSAPPVVGGVETVLAQHARLMADAGHEVTIIAGRGGQFDPRIRFVSLPLVDSRHPDILAAKARLDQGIAPDNFRALTEAIFDEIAPALTGVDILIAHNVCSLHKNLPLTAALHRLLEQAGSPRLILWHHDLAWTTPRYHTELHDGAPWDLLRRAWPGAANVVVSDLRQQELSGLYGIAREEIPVIPNGVDIAAFFKLEAQTQALIGRLRLLEAGPLLLLPVRITPRKNIELALGALAALRERMPGARLIVTGPLGPHNPANAGYFGRLKSLCMELGIEEAAYFLAELSDGFLPDAVIADCYRLADALIFPSREEGFGIPVLEAGLTGIPVFCADIPPLRALGGEEVSYFLPDDDPEHIAELIAERLAGDPVFRLRARVRQAYTWERVYAGLIAPLLGEDNEAHT